MDKRTLLIILGLLLPIFALALLVNSPPEEQPAAGIQQQAPRQGSKSAAPRRLPPLERKASARNEAVDINRPAPAPGNRRPPANLDEARERAQRELDRLNNMTPEQWKAEQDRREAGRRWFEGLSPEDKARVRSGQPPLDGPPAP